MKPPSLVPFRLAAFFLLVLPTATPLQSAPFIRGDVDGNGPLELTDPVRILEYLYLESPESLDCLDAADVNGDRQVDISDPIRFLVYLYLAGEEPPAPFPACGEGPQDGLGCAASSCSRFSVLKGNLERDPSPEVEPGEVEQLVRGNTAFGLDIYRSLRGTGDNLFISPYSISQALAMTCAGARGETERQMLAALQFGLPQERLHPAFNALDLALASRGEGLELEKGDRFRLRAVNSLWGQRDYTFLPVFLDTLSLNYGAGMNLLDFRSDPEFCRLTINDWVSLMTETRIKDLLPPGIISAATRLVLTNAIYFSASWKYPFMKELTQEESFQTLGGGTVRVLMMDLAANFRYVQTKGVQAVELPYVGDELSMVVILPAEGTLDSFEASLNGELLGSILSGLEEVHLELRMPRFCFEAGPLSLKLALMGLGMEDAFTASADFSGIGGIPELYIHDVLHKTFVSVDEDGTEAAAATAVVIDVTAVPPTVMLDRPFLFLIRDIPTGAVLFLGRVGNPAG